MIKIIREGLYGKVFFECKQCYCQFIVDEQECEQDWNNHAIPWIYECPKCKAKCSSDKGCKRKAIGGLPNELE